MRALRLRCLVAGGLVLAGCGGDAPRPGAAGAGSADADFPDPRAATPSAPASHAPDMEAGDTLPIAVTATVDGKRFEASGRGACNHTTSASIYQAPAAQWAYRYSAATPGAALEHVNATVWEIRSGGVQVSLSLRAGGREHSISNVKGGTLEGQGSARATPRGNGGTLSVEGTTADGRRITLTAVCERTVEPVAAGG